MTPKRAPSGPPNDGTSVIVHLSGVHRGQTDALSSHVASLGTAPGSDVHLSERDRPRPGSTHAVLRRRGRTYELFAEPDHEVWVNGENVDQLVLASGDVLEIGRSGPVLRFRQYPAGSRATRSVPEVFSDCAECAKHASDKRLGRMGVFLAEFPRALATQTSTLFRGGVVVVLAVLAMVTFNLSRETDAIEETLNTELGRVGELVEQLDTSEPAQVSPADVERWRAELANDVAEAARRLEALEQRSGAAAQVIAAASASVVFLQGGYGFRDPETGRPLRTVNGPQGEPVRNARGMPLVTLDGDGPVFEAFYTGTGFVASQDGLVLTNRHVALPWEFDAAAAQIVERGLEPVMLRFVGYLPGYEEPFDMVTVNASPEADVALLRGVGATELQHLTLATRRPEPGDQVLVLGYPLGLRALLARVEPSEIETITAEGSPDFFETARRLSRADHIAPLASQGIVGQSTARFLVYDAETTSGGSGGPVLNLDGEVVAVNAAILPEFGGSNLGVPIERGRRLLASTGPGGEAVER